MPRSYIREIFRKLNMKDMLIGWTVRALFPGEGPVPRNPCSTIPVPEVDVGFPTGDDAAAVTRVEANGED